MLPAFLTPTAVDGYGGLYDHSSLMKTDEYAFASYHPALLAHYQINSGDLSAPNCSLESLLLPLLLLSSSSLVRRSSKFLLRRMESRTLWPSGWYGEARTDTTAVFADTAKPHSDHFLYTSLIMLQCHHWSRPRRRYRPHLTKRKEKKFALQ